MSPGQVRFQFDIYSIKIPWVLLQASNVIHKVRPSAKSVPADRRIRSLETYIDTFKGEALTIKEDGGAKSYDAGVQ